MTVKKGDKIRVVRERLADSLEAKASDPALPNYIFTTDGKVMEIRGDYALVQFAHVSTPDFWLRVEQLTSA
jgi:hypothetical protein